MSPGEWAGVTVAALAVLGAIARGIQACYRAARRIERIAEHAKQLSPNSGSSLYDRVAQIHEIVHTNSERLDTVEGRLDEQEVRAHKNEGRIEAIALVTSPTMLIEDEEGVIRESRRKSAQR